MCDCIERVNRELYSRQLIVSQSLLIKKSNLGVSPAIIATENTFTHKASKIPLFATFCPFCGEKYPTIEDKR